MGKMVSFIAAQRNVHKELKDEMPKVLKFLQAFWANAAIWRDREETAMPVVKAETKAAVNMVDATTDIPLNLTLPNQT